MKIHPIKLPNIMYTHIYTNPDFQVTWISKSLFITEYILLFKFKRIENWKIYFSIIILSKQLFCLNWSTE
jgi:hypothetical protein